MANEFRKVTDQNGVDHPVCDDNRVDWSSYAKTGVHNQLLNTAVTNTKEGVTYTVNEDKSITTSNGTTTELSYCWISLKGVKFADGLPRILTGCPAGGSTSGYYLRLGSGTTETIADTDLDTYVGGDIGSGLSFTPDPTKYYHVQIRVNNNTSVDGKVFKPMIRLASDTDPTYQPYAMTNRELTEQVTVKSDSITSSFTANGDVANELKKIGEIVFIDAAYKEVTASQWDVIATIPSGFRPKTPCRLLDGFGRKCLVINVNGDIQAAEGISNTYVYIHGSWVVS